MGKRKTSISEVSTGKCQRKPHLRLVLILSHSPDAGEQVFRRKKRVVPLIFPKHTENWVLSLWETRGGTQLPPPSYITTTFSKLSFLLQQNIPRAWLLQAVPASSRRDVRENHLIWPKGRNQDQSFLSSPACHSSADCCLKQCLRCKQNSQKSFPGLLRVIHIH